MSEFNITVEGGSSVRLPTEGKYCDRDIVITATGGTDALDAFVEGATEITSNASFVGKIVFRSNKSVQKINLPVATSIESEGFSYNSTLIEMYAPEMLTLKNNAFYDAKKVEKIDMRKVTYIGLNCFYNCICLAEFYAPKATNCQSCAFQKCSALQYVELGALTETNRIYTKTFDGAISLTAIVIRATNLITLDNVNAFTDTPIANGTGYIYIPSSLISSFQAATNWSTFANQFRALEDYTVDGTVTGEFDRTKI